MKGFLGLEDPLPKWFILGWKVDSSSHGTLCRAVGVLQDMTADFPPREQSKRPRLKYQYLS